MDLWKNNKIIFLIYGGSSLITFGVMGYDKKQALAGQWRIPEKTLHTLEFLGGWPGSLAAQKFFHHKSIKKEYQTVFWSIVGIHAVFLATLFSGGTKNLNILSIIEKVTGKNGKFFH
jgi:uncharacterized membrane protein YsdA (DUF1294 family)